MKKSIVLVSIFTLLLIGCVGFSSCESSNGPELIFIHTNDTHSQIDGIYLDEQPNGGVIERAAFLELMRQEDPQLTYLDAGDMVQGSPYFNIWKGMVEMKAMNLQGLICSTFGNHEFDNGIPFLANMLNYACFPIVNCNYDVSDTQLKDYVRRYMIIERKGVRIGITGVTVDPHNLIFNRNWEGIIYNEPAAAATEAAAELRAEGCDLVILLSHLGYYQEDSIGDRYVAAHSKGIDIIIGGHSHSNIENGEIVMNQENKPVVITQTGGKAKPMGIIRVKMQKDGKHKNGGEAFKIENIECKKLHPDLYNLNSYGRGMRDFITPYRDSLEYKMNAVLGRAKHDLPRFRPESPLGNLTSDILREVGSENSSHPIDVGIMNVGGLRNDLYAGDIKLGDIYRVFPFENTLAIVELKGKHLEEIIHQCESKRLEAFSGVKIDLNIVHSTKPDGELQEDIKATNIMVGGEPIDPERIYYIATIDYLAEGNDNLTAFTKAEKYTNTGILLRDLMVDYIKKKGIQKVDIDAQIDNRINVNEVTENAQ